MVAPPGKKSPQNRQTPQEADDERRRHKRVDAPLKGRFLNEYGTEETCIVVNISAGGALLKAKNPPPFGSTVLLYVDQVGRFEGRVIRSDPKMFAVAYEKKRAKSSRTADGLTQVVNRGVKSPDRRGTPRIQHDEPALVYFEDGRAERCAILDISLTGASIEIMPRPPLGARLIVGRMTAKVVRRHDKGVGVVFTGSAKRMDEVITKTAEPLAYAAPPAPAGAGVAKSFGKKSSNADQ